MAGRRRKPRRWGKLQGISRDFKGFSGKES